MRGCVCSLQDTTLSSGKAEWNGYSRSTRGEAHPISATQKECLVRPQSAAILIKRVLFSVDDKLLHGEVAVQGCLAVHTV